MVLSTTYLDERVRLGKGSKGSLFVFTRGGAAEQAGAGCCMEGGPLGLGHAGAKYTCLLGWLLGEARWCMAAWWRL